MFSDLQLGSICEPESSRTWTPERIRREVDRRAARYRSLGLCPGQRVFLHEGNCLEFFADLLAVWRLGACAIPLDARLSPFEIETLARAARPQLTVRRGLMDARTFERLRALQIEVVDTEATDAVPEPRELPPVFPRLDDDALILFTSGTTGDPKGVVHTHRSLRARWTSLRQSAGLAHMHRSLCLLPTHFGHGLICNALYPWLSGCDLFIVPPFQSELAMKLGEVIDEHEISFLSSVPAVWKLALRTARPPERNSLGRVFCGSAPLSGSLWSDIRRWAGTDEVWNTYGITETGSWLAGTSQGTFTPSDGLIGKPWGGSIAVLESGTTDRSPQELRVCGPEEAGHIWVNTPALMRGYFERDDLTDEVVSQGWFSTGDIGVLDERGLLTLRGREREEINKGGAKVYPGDVDGVAERFAGVRDVCTFAVDDRHYGQNVGMAVSLDTADSDKLREFYNFLDEHLANYQMPVRWYVVDAIERTSRGKLNRARVAERCREQAPVNLRTVLSKGA